MEFVSKQQTYEALRKLLLEYAAQQSDPNLEDLARNMEMDGDRSREPAFYQRFLDTLMSDPLEPQDALDAASQFMEQNVNANGNADLAKSIRRARATAQNPESDPEFWNHWIDLLGRV